MRIFTPKLAARRSPGVIPGSLHVLRLQDLKGATDSDDLDDARSKDFIVVSKDRDFYENNLPLGGPPWVTFGYGRFNPGTGTSVTLLALLGSETQAIRQLCYAPALPSERGGRLCPQTLVQPLTNTDHDREHAWGQWEQADSADRVVVAKRGSSPIPAVNL